jgi:protein TonB
VKRATVVISLAVHAAVAWSLVGAAKQGEKRKAIQVAVASAKKKAEPPKPPPPPPVRPRAAPKVVAAAPKPAAITEAPKPVARVPVATALAMSNDDAPGGIALGPSGGGGPSGKAAAAAPTRVASAVSSSRTKRAREALGEASAGAGDSGSGAGDAPCEEEPTKPVPVSKTDFEYTVAAKTEGIEGKIKVRFTVAADGSVSDVDVLKGLEAALDAVAVSAARQWRFTPAMRCGKPVAGGTYVFQKTFELTD